MKFRNCCAYLLIETFYKIVYISKVYFILNALKLWLLTQLKVVVEKINNFFFVYVISYLNNSLFQWKIPSVKLWDNILIHSCTIPLE